MYILDTIIRSVLALVPVFSIGTFIDGGYNSTIGTLVWMAVIAWIQLYLVKKLDEYYGFGC